MSLSQEELEKFRKSQRLAYQCAVTIGKELQEGWTEKQTADLMDTFLKDSGVKTFFHKSFAWFGDRTRFLGFTKYRHFMPSEKRLRQSDVIILDTAPIFEGYTSDIGYTMSLEPNPKLEKAKKSLIRYRNLILELFENKIPTQEIWNKIDTAIKTDGYDNCHSMYPFSVLGHQVHKIGFNFLPGFSKPFSIHSYLSIIMRGIYPELLGPKHKGDPTGLWAIEPHLGADGFGAKFEEILVVTPEKVYWLDDHVPHLE